MIHVFKRWSTVSQVACVAAALLVAAVVLTRLGPRAAEAQAAVPQAPPDWFAIALGSAPGDRATAIRELIQTNDTRIAPHLRAIVPSLRPRDQVVVMGTLLAKPVALKRETFPQVAQIARDAAAAPETGSPRERELVVGVSALLIAATGCPDQPTLLASLAARQPQSPAVWYALGQCGQVAGDTEALADTTLRRLRSGDLRDPHGRLEPTLIAVLATRRPDQEAALRALVDRTIAEHGAKTAADYQPTTPDYFHGSEAYRRLEGSLRIVSLLRWVPATWARDAVVRMLHVENDLLRTSAQLVAAERWPDLVLAPGLARRPPDSVFALVAALHPDRRTEVEARIGTAAFASETQALERQSMVGIFDSPGTAVFSFSL